MHTQIMAKAATTTAIRSINGEAPTVKESWSLYLLWFPSRNSFITAACYYLHISMYIYVFIYKCFVWEYVSVRTYINHEINYDNPFTVHWCILSVVWQQKKLIHIYTHYAKTRNKNRLIERQEIEFEWMSECKKNAFFSCSVPRNCCHLLNFETKQLESD